VNNKQIERIFSIKNDFHKVGILGAPVLRRIHEFAKSCDNLCTAETGSGQSTLYFSQISDCHTVFALNDVAEVDTKSVSAVNASPLLNKKSVKFVIGPTQKTLPAYSFTNALDIVLIDGPHAYPYPELEYYYFYPHIKPGGLLVIDDIHIPTIANLFSFLVYESMFDLVDVVGYTAFFMRNDYETFPTDQDNWWLQKYNTENKKYLISALHNYQHDAGNMPFRLYYNSCQDGDNYCPDTNTTCNHNQARSLSVAPENDSRMEKFWFRFKVWLYDSAELFFGHRFAITALDFVRKLLGKKPPLG